MSRENKSIPIRINKKFLDQYINKIKIERQRLFPKEKLKPISSSRITLAMARHFDMKKIMNDIIRADLKWRPVLDVKNQ